MVFAKHQHFESTAGAVRCGALVCVRRSLRASSSDASETRDLWSTVRFAVGAGAGAGAAAAVR